MNVPGYSSTAVHVPRYLLGLGLGLGLGHAQITAVLHQILHDLIFIQISALVKYYSAGGVLLLLRFPRIRSRGHQSQTRNRAASADYYYTNLF
jgi:hypothetical protein